MSSRQLLAALLLAGMSGAQANLVVNGSFESGVFSGGSFGFPLAQQVNPGDSSTLPGWTVQGAELAWFKNGQAGINVGDGQFALDLTGFCDLGLGCGPDGVYSTVRQSLATVAGATYSLSFAVGNYSFNTAQPTIEVDAGTSHRSFAVPSSPHASGDWTVETFLFTATGSTTDLVFSGSGGARGQTFYLGLDSVDVELSSPPVGTVPEPATWTLLGAAAGALLLRRRAGRTAAP